MCPKHRVIEPDAKAARIYEGMYRLYRKLYFGFGSTSSAPVAVGDVLPSLRSPIESGGGPRIMILQTLREQVLEANLEVVRRGLVLYTFGNASGIDRDQGIVAIKPSGVPYETLRASDIVLVDLEGRAMQGALRPSSDLPTHLVLYRAFESIGGIVHTHSRAATSWAQAAREIPCLGTTHADYFHGPVPVTRELSSDEIADDYETNTGHPNRPAVSEH